MIDNLTFYFGILIAIQVLHLIEEIRGDFRRKFPLGKVPKPIFIIGNIALYGFAITALYLSYVNAPVAIKMIWIFTILMLLNGVGHMVIMIIRKMYFPGGITAFPLLLLSLYIIQLLRDL
ncbi:MAG: HXXEE domain-containing protein [candidate division Zixibacteria bacterium]|nr:HXXEE domain-containing protein [candidate division Zixibacteria bacterium]